MTTPRIFVDAPLSPDLLIDLPAAATRHIQVLRLQPGDTVELFNGQGSAFHSRIVTMRKTSVQVAIASELLADPALELPVAVHLYVGMPANERMDWLVEKATELGAASITPLHCTRSVLRLHGERAVRRTEHWQNIARAACAQSGRLVVPKLNTPISLPEILPALRDAQKRTWVLAPHASLTLSAWQEHCQRQKPHDLHFISGPEGGLAEDELALLTQHAIPGLHLGRRILRAETAPLLPLATLHTLALSAL